METMKVCLRVWGMWCLRARWRALPVLAITVFVMTPASAGVGRAQQPWYHDAPPDMRAFFVAARKADRIKDPLQRCLAYPDYPGNHWPKGLANFYCRYLFGPHITLEDIRDAVRSGHYQALDKRYAADLAKHFSTTHFEAVIHTDFSTIHYTKSVQKLHELDQLTQAWLSAEPNSAYALAVRAEYLRAMAWKIRGTDWDVAMPVSMEIAALDNVHIAMDSTLLLLGIRPPLQSIYYDLGSLARRATRTRRPRTAFDYADAGIKLDRRALEIEPKLLPAYVTIADLGGMAGREEMAKWAFSAGSRVDPACKVLTGAAMSNRSPRWGGSHQAMVKLKKQLEAEARQRPFLERTIIMPRLDKADELRMHKAYDQAYATIQPALLRSPDAGAFQLAARILADVNPSKPLKQFEYLLEASRFNPEGDAWVSYTRALFMLQSAKDPQWALSSMQVAVQADPDDPKGHFFLGLTYMDLDANTKAKKEFTFVAGIDNDFKYPAIMNLAIIALEQKDPAKAQPYLEAFLDKHPDSVHGWDLRGVAFMQSHDLDAARAAFTTALEKAGKQDRHDIFVTKAGRLLHKVDQMIIDSRLN